MSVGDFMRNPPSLESLKLPKGLDVIQEAGKTVEEE